MKQILVAFLLALVPSAYAQKTCGYRQVRAIWQDAANPIQGVRSTFDIVNLGGGETKSVWVALTFDNDIWYQVGYFNWGKNPQAVVMCFGSGCVGRTVITLAPIPTLVVGTQGTFGFYKTDGEWWHLVLNGVETSRINFGDTQGHIVQLATEQGYSCKAGRFPTVRFYPALEFYRDGQWVPAQTAYANGVSWGIEGKLQNPGLIDNELRMGSAVPVFSYSGFPNLTLWGVQ